MHCPICRDYGVDRILDSAEVVITVSREDAISACLAAFICKNNHIFFVRKVDLETTEDVAENIALRAS